MGIPLYLRNIHYVGFTTSTIFNVLLTYLILAKSSKKIGSYKNLMLAFSIYSIFYSCIEFCVQPVMYSQGAMIMMFVDSFLKEEKDYSFILLCLYVSTFSLCVCLLAGHFFYRYLAICKSDSLIGLQGFKMFKLFLPALMLSSSWGVYSYLFAKQTDLKSEIMSEGLREAYGIDIYNTPYIAILYYHRTSSGELIVDYLDWICTSISIFVMGSSFTTILICGQKCYSALNGVSNMSRHTKELNNQLFRTLIVQTLVPICTLFTPVGFLFILPIFSIELGTWANIPTLNVSIYPALDALIVMLMNLFVIIIGSHMIWQCAKKKKGVTSNDLMVKSAMRPPQTETVPSAKTEEQKKEEKKEEKDDKPAADAAATTPADKKDEEKKTEENKDDKEKEKKEEKKIAQSMKPFPKFVMPTESVKKRKEKENEEDKQKKIKEGFYQQNSGEDDTLEKVKSLEVEKSDKTKRSQRKKK